MTVLYAILVITGDDTSTFGLYTDAKCAMRAIEETFPIDFRNEHHPFVSPGIECPHDVRTGYELWIDPTQVRDWRTTRRLRRSKISPSPGCVRLVIDDIILHDNLVETDVLSSYDECCGRKTHTPLSLQQLHLLAAVHLECSPLGFDVPPIGGISEVEELVDRMRSAVARDSTRKRDVQSFVEMLAAGSMRMPASDRFTTSSFPFLTW
jgi:hypothetical protein